MFMLLKWVKQILKQSLKTIVEDWLASADVEALRDLFNLEQLQVELEELSEAAKESGPEFFEKLEKMALKVLEFGAVRHLFYEVAYNPHLYEQITEGLDLAKLSTKVEALFNENNIDIWKVKGHYMTKYIGLDNSLEILQRINYLGYESYSDESIERIIIPVHGESKAYTPNWIHAIYTANQSAGLIAMRGLGSDVEEE